MPTPQAIDTPPVAVPLLDLSEQHDTLMPELRKVFDHVIESGQFVLGPFVETFERELAAYCKVKHAIGLSSGTDALIAAMMALDIGPGDEVITTPFTFFSTASSVVRLGATPVFVDINPRTFNIEAQDIEGAITKKTKAIIPVHLFGLPADMEAIQKIADAHGLKVIEDAAQALGARCDGQPVGGLGDIGCLSFYPTKNLSAMGDAGACVTNDDALAQKIRMLRVHGADQGYHYPLVGGNFRLDALHAALLSVKLPHLDAWNDARREHADHYSRALEDLPVSTPFEPPVRHHVYNQYTIRVRSGGRDALRGHLAACEIGSRVYYPLPLHLQPCFAYLGYKRGRLPIAEAAADEVLSLPVFPEMTRIQQEAVIDAISDYFRAE